MLAGVGLLSQMGFAIAAEILIVAILMACVLVPSLATLLGDRMWWPGRRPEAAADAAHRLRRTRGTLEPPGSAVTHRDAGLRRRGARAGRRR